MAERHGERRHHPTTEPAPTLRSRTGGAGAIRFIRTEQRDTMPAPTVPTVGNQYLHAVDPGVRVLGGGRNPQTRDGKPIRKGDVRTLRDITDEPSTTIAAQVGGGAGNAGPFVVTRAGSEPERLDRPADCLSAGSADGHPNGRSIMGANQASREKLLDAIGRRRLSISECAALFSMPPDYPWQGTQTSQYKQIGNMCAWEVVAALGRAVLDAAP